MRYEVTYTSERHTAGCFHRGYFKHRQVIKAKSRAEIIKSVNAAQEKHNLIVRVEEWSDDKTAYICTLVNTRMTVRYLAVAMDPQGPEHYTKTLLKKLA